MQLLQCKKPNCKLEYPHLHSSKEYRKVEEAFGLGFNVWTDGKVEFIDNEMIMRKQ